jgi:acyl-CoA thioester hydrolase|tara:strand:- start:8990 stop:9409 length:420 start_codon:yes stop_codon:yes gene_type:complete
MKSVYATVQKEIKIQFYDLDPMDIVWHGNYVRFFEDARSELLNKIGYNYQEMKNSGYAWPVIDLHIRYIKSIKFKHKIIIQADLVEYEFRLKILYTIFEKNNKTRLCKGHTVQVAIDYKTKEMQFVSPKILAHKLGQKI